MADQKDAGGASVHHADQLPLQPKYRLKSRQRTRIRLDPHPNSPNPDDSETVRQWLGTRPRPWAIDLFCGAGGLSLGLEEAGFSVIAAADSDPTSIETHSANIGGLTWTGDLSKPDDFISRLNEWGVRDIDLLAGGPPCQPFSNAGASKIGDLVRRGQRQPRDERADLWQSFFALVDELAPKVVLFENVPAFARAQDGALLVALIDELRQRGYGVHTKVLNAWQFQVPQHRSRLFIVGVAGEGDFEWPQPEGTRPTVGQAIADLPVVGADSSAEELPYEGPPRTALARTLRKGLPKAESRLIRDHVTRAVRPDDAEIYSLLEPGGTYLDVPERLRRYRSDIFNDKYLRLKFDDLARTITAHIAKDGYWYIHPKENRTLSIREAARIQTFPDRFRFAGAPTSRFRQIGNAVPPLLASAIGFAIRRSLDMRAGDLTVSNQSSPQESVGSSFRDDLLAWFDKNRRSFLWRNADLNPWQTLVIEMCLHRTRAEQVAQVANEILHLANTPESFLDNLDALQPTLNSLGLQWRLENLSRAATYIRDDLDGQIPDNWQELDAIPGVGDYIASAVLCFAFGRPSVLLDTNTKRIARRVLGNPDGADWQHRLSLRQLAGEEGADSRWNQALLDLGALRCTARAPRCGECPVAAHCLTGRETTGSSQ